MQKFLALPLLTLVLLSQGPVLAKEPEQKTDTVQNAESNGDKSKPASKTPAGGAGEAASRYETRDEHDPNGIGKFYMDREIAHVMGFLAADWLERPERESEEKLTTLVEALKLKPGMVVADIGAGSGRISIMIAEKLGKDGKVLAVDVQEEMLSLLSKKLKQQKITNIEPVLGNPESPKLEPGSIDLAIMVDVYHEFEFPYEMLREIAKALRPGGRVAFVEYRREDPKVRRMIKLVHTMTEAQVKKEASLPEFELEWKETIRALPVQHIIVFEKAEADQRTKNSKQ
jgi:ubiquinone/menaquinone biosynthesis C-methylase UbiE